MINKNKKININKNANLIIKTLHDNGYEAYIVGGCVRDILLGKRPDDYDITTNALPDDIKKIFRKTVDTGIKHGTISILLRDENKNIKPYEVTTYRIDGEYEDGRHPKEVRFVSNLKEDLSRRDFTINAMAYNDKEGLVDLFNGIDDLKHKLVRCVGVATDRYEEDALRMLRAIRFSAKLDFIIDDDTYLAIKVKAPNIQKVSKERIQVEISKILLSNNPKNIMYLYDTNLAQYIDGFNEFKPVEKYIMKTKKLNIAYAGLLYHNTDICDKLLRGLKLDNETIKNTKILLDLKDEYLVYKNNKEIDVNKTFDLFEKLNTTFCQKEIISNIGYDLFFDFLEMISQTKDLYVANIIRNVEKIKKNKEPVFMKDLVIGGKDLMAIGYRGKEVGIALNYLLKIVHKNKNYNEKDTLINMAEKIYKEVYNIID